MMAGHKTKALDGPFLVMPNANSRSVDCLLMDWQLAFGTGSTWRKEKPATLDNDLVNMVKEALQSGYRHLDTAECECRKIYPVGQSLTAWSV